MLAVASARSAAAYCTGYEPGIPVIGRRVGYLSDAAAQMGHHLPPTHHLHMVLCGHVGEGSNLDSVHWVSHCRALVPTTD